MEAQFPEEHSEDGSFERQEDAFRAWVEDRPDAAFPAEAGRYHLYVSLACPWAHRTIVLRALKGLESLIGMTVVDPIRDEKGWRFSSDEPCQPDPVNGWSYLEQAYRSTDPSFSGRVTVPVLWDRETARIVSNSDDDIMRMFNSAFDRCGANSEDFYPEHLHEEIDRLNDRIYETVNNGVYKAGFATTQKSYEGAVYPLFATLDEIEQGLERSPYLLGDRITESDWRLWVTLVRFDPIYYVHFKCNLRLIAQYPRLSDYLKRLSAIPGIADTINFDHIKRHYYLTHPKLNPSGIVPVGPRA